MTYLELKPYLDRLKLHEYLVITSSEKGERLAVLYFDKKQKLHEYVNVINNRLIARKGKVKDIDNDYKLSNIDLSEANVSFIPYPLFWKMLSNENYRWFYSECDKSADSTASQLLEEVKRDQGKLIKMKGEEDKLTLLSICASDEDFYYVTMTEYGMIHLFSCAMGYDVIEENHKSKFTDEQIYELLIDHFEEVNVYDALLYLGKYQLKENEYGKR